MRLYAESPFFFLEVNCEGRGIFAYEKDNPIVEVFWEPGGTGPEHYFATIGAAIFNELRGIPCLHGNGLCFEGHCLGLLGGSTAGKSTLSAALAQYGCKIIGDDMLVLHSVDKCWQLRLAKPVVRLWPDSIENLFDHSRIEKSEKVHSQFEKRTLVIDDTSARWTASATAKLSALYLLSRIADKQSFSCKIESISPSDALIELLRESSLSDVTKVLGLDISRISLLKQVVEQVPVKRITYSSGFSYLPTICEKLSKDFIKSLSVRNVA